VRCEAKVLAASHRDLRGLVTEGAFRQDLYFRIAGRRVLVPALRERSEDIPALVREIAGSVVAGAAFTPAALAVLQAYDWPGNVRQLKTVVSRLVHDTVEGEVDARDVEADAEREGYAEAHAHAAAASGAVEAATLEDFRTRVKSADAALERQFLARAMKRAGGKVSEAARLVACDRMALERMLRKHGMK